MTNTYTGTGGLLSLIVAEAKVAALGACASHPDPDLWHREDRAEPEFCAGCTAAAVAICQTCPIQSWCDAKAAGELSGVWAGRPRSTATDNRRKQEGHSCITGRRAANAARQAAFRLRHAATG